MRPRSILPALVVMSVAVTNCASPPTVETIEMRAPAASAEGDDEALDPRGEPSAPPQVSTTTGRDGEDTILRFAAYSFVIQLRGRVDGMLHDLEYSGWFDPMTADSYVTVPAADLARSLGNDASDVDPELVVEQVTIGGASWTRGLHPRLDFSDDVQPDVWYVDGALGVGNVGLLGEIQRFADLRALLEPYGVSAAATEPGEIEALVVELDEVDIDELSGRAAIVDQVPVDSTVTITVGGDDRGWISRALYSTVYEEEPLEARVDLVIDGPEFEFPEIVDPQELPPANDDGLASDPNGPPTNDDTLAVDPNGPPTNDDTLAVDANGPPVNDDTLAVDANGPPVNDDTLASDPNRPEHVVDPLFLDVTDLGPDWSTSAPADAPPPLDVVACPDGPGPADRAVRLFDSWMMRIGTAKGPDGIELLQLVGFSPSRGGADEVVDLIAPFDDCDAPFLQHGIVDFTSGDLVDRPPRVTAASYWSFARLGGDFVVVADIALDDRIVMVLSLSSPAPLSAADVDDLVVAASERMPRFERSLVACASDPAAELAADCRGIGTW